MPTQIDRDTILETFNLKSEDVDRVIAKITDLIHEGTVRRIVVKDAEGRTLAVIPMTVGVVGAVLAPQLAAIGAIVAIVADCSIVVEKEKAP